MSLDRLIFDPADTTQSHNVGAYLRAGSDGDLITSTTVGGKEALDVNIVAGPDDPIYAEDSASADGENLMAVAAVRQATLADSLSADGDHGWLKLNNRGAMWVAPVGSVNDDDSDSEYPVKMGSVARSGLLAAISASGDRANLISDMYRRVYINDSHNVGLKSTDVDVDNVVEVALPASPLAGRREMIVQNLGPKDIFVGETGVTVSTGTRIVNGGSHTFKLGQNNVLFAISNSAVVSDVRCFESA